MWADRVKGLGGKLEREELEKKKDCRREKNRIWVKG